MNYTPTDWKTGDVITAPKLLNIENGLVNAASEINVLETTKIDDAPINRNMYARQDGDWAPFVLPEQIPPLVATICPISTVTFQFSEDGSTFSFTGGTYFWMASKGNYGVATFGAQFDIPYITGRVFVLNVTDPNAATVSSRSLNSGTVFNENEYVIGNMFNYNTNPVTQTVTIYGSGAYTWSALAGHHEAYGSILNTDDTLDLVIGGITVRARKKDTVNAEVSVLATNTNLPNIDIRRFSIYGDASEGKAFDSITLTNTTPIVVDDTVLTSSNDTCILWIGNGAQMIEVKIFISGNGARCRIVSDFLS